MKCYNLLVLGTIIVFMSCQEKLKSESFSLQEIEKTRILENIESFKNLKPITVTDSVCERSAGTKHDFYSEGDYWWPNPQDLDGAYIRKDGLSNPDNFKFHRKSLIRLNHIAGKLTSAYLNTKDESYLKALLPHLESWFVNEDTKMNPSLRHAQAIKGKVIGRGIGIIDTIHLVEVALAVEVLEDSEMISKSKIESIKAWFSSYNNWLTTHPFGIKERDNGNNHSVCWAVQVAAFARLTNDEDKLNYCRQFYKDVLLPDQMAKDGSFPKELSRTKPYGYSLFNLDAMANLCQIASIEGDNLFEYQTENSLSIKQGLDFMYPYIKDKTTWPYKEDVMYYEDWPVRQSALLFGGTAFNNENYLNLWKSLDGNFEVEEIERNMPVKYPLLWVR